MKKRHLVFLIVIVILLLAGGGGSSFAQEKPAGRDELIGFWVNYFPVPDQAFGYIFLKDGTYVFYQEPYNGNDKYSGSIGKWKIENNKIMIFQEKEFYWKDYWYDDGNVGFTPGEGNKRYSIPGDRVWKVIGDIRSLSAEIFTGKGKNDVSKPANLLLSKIIDSRVTESESPYWRIDKDPLRNESLMEEIDKRKGL